MGNYVMFKTTAISNSIISGSRREESLCGELLAKLLSAKAPAGARVLTGYLPSPASAASPFPLLGKRGVLTFFRAALNALSRIFTPEREAAAQTLI